MKVGITGQSGFIGTHLFNTLALDPTIERIIFDDSYFDNNRTLREFVRNCDVIVHLAAMNRHEDQQMIHDVNIGLVSKLTAAMEEEKVTPHVVFSSSTQETADNPYGRSKLKGREIFEQWATKNGASFTGLVVPNVFGEFSRPNYNTFIATFAHKLVNGETPQILADNDVRLIYVGSLCHFIIQQMKLSGIRRVDVPYDFQRKVSDILALFNEFKSLYFDKGFIPALNDRNDVNLFNTFRSFIPPQKRELVRHSDERGVFVETLKLGTGGQVSFSTTVPGVTRGDHYHTRKIERFTVIHGQAVILLRRVGTDESLEFMLDGSVPSYVDMPVWYTHNITNIGSEDLYTQFWINEWYVPEDGDTYFEKV